MPDPTYEQVVEAVRDHLGKPAFEHSVAVAMGAASLARVYGLDVEAARLAGLLHDWAREANPDQLLDEARASGREVTAADERVPYLLHAEKGAEEVREAFPWLSDEVISAIAHHTVGAPEMSRLDMAVYLADMLEPARSYEGVEGLRDSVGVASIEDLYARAYAVSLHHLIDRGRIIHPVTVDVWNAIVAKGSR